MADTKNNANPGGTKKAAAKPLPQSAPEIDLDAVAALSTDDNKQPASQADAGLAPLGQHDDEPVDLNPATNSNIDLDIHPAARLGKLGTDEEPADSVAQSTPSGAGAAPTKNPFKRFARFYGRHKRWMISLTLLVIVGALAGVPWSRYFILGQFMTQQYGVVLLDTKTNKPVSGAKVTIGAASAVTDSKGKASLPAKVGKHQVTVDKKYYAAFSSQIFVGIKRQANPQPLNIVATGRQVPLTVINKITGQPLEDVSLKAADTEVKTAKDGKVSMVLPANESVLNVTLTAKGYNGLQTTVQVTEQEVKQNTFSLTPSGQVYFLSKQSGKLDVVKTNLDGSDRQVVLGGTGKEDDSTTQLLASRDWRYLALYSKRGSELAKLYLINTDTNKLTTIDGVNANFTLVGWSDHNFVYQTTRNDNTFWEANREAIKSYNADNGQTLTIDQNQVDGDQSAYAYQDFGNVYELGNQVFYISRWVGYYKTVAGKTSALRVASAKSTAKKDVKTFDASDISYFDAVSYKPDELYVSAFSSSTGKTDYYEVEVGNDISVKSANIDQETFYRGDYPTYLASPSGNKTFWTESRDGRNVFFVGDAGGANGKQISTQDDYTPYGWYSDDYVLLSKKGSELYIMASSGGSLLKLTDFHKPAATLRGYGGGYGGL